MGQDRYFERPELVTMTCSLLRSRTAVTVVVQDWPSFDCRIMRAPTSSGGRIGGIAEVDGAPGAGFQVVGTPSWERIAEAQALAAVVSGVPFSFSFFGSRSNSSRSWGARASSRAWRSQSRVLESWSAFFLTTEPMRIN